MNVPENEYFLSRWRSLIRCETTKVWYDRLITNSFNFGGEFYITLQYFKVTGQILTGKTGLIHSRLCHSLKRYSCKITLNNNILVLFTWYMTECWISFYLFLPRCRLRGWCFWKWNDRKYLNERQLWLFLIFQNLRLLTYLNRDYFVIQVRTQTLQINDFSSRVFKEASKECYQYNI